MKIIKRIITIVCTIVFPIMLTVFILFSFIVMNSNSHYEIWLSFFINQRIFKLGYDSIQSITFGFLSLLIASFFTALSITLNKPNVSINAYFKFQGLKRYFFYLLSLITFVVWLILINYEYVIVFARVIFILGIFNSVSFFILLIWDMDIITNREKMLASTGKKILLALKKEQQFINKTLKIEAIDNAALGFCIKCINSLDDGSKLSGYKLIQKWIEALNLSTDDERLILEYFFVNQSHPIFENDRYDDEDFDYYAKCLLFSAMGYWTGSKFEIVLERFLFVYSEWMIKYELSPHYLIVLKDALFIYKNKEDNGHSLDEIKDIYQKAFKSCTEIIVNSIRNDNNKRVESLIHNFCQISQFLNFDENGKELLQSFDNSLMRIATYVAALIVAKRIEAKNYTYLILSIINQVNTIDTSMISFYYYPEVLPPVDVHIVTKTYEYYLGLIILYYVCYKTKNENKSDIFEELLVEKLFFNKNTEGKLEIETRLFENINKIFPDSYLIDDFLSNDDFAVCLDRMKKVLAEKMDEEKYSILELLKKRRKKMIFDEEKKILNEFMELNIIKEERVFKYSASINSNIVLSDANYLNEPNYANSFLPILHSLYDSRYSMSDNKTIGITFEQFLKRNKKGGKFIVPFRIHSALWEKQIEGIEYTVNGIKYYNDKEEKPVELQFVYYKGNNVYNMENVYKNTFISSITFHENQMDINRDTISLSVPFTVTFGFDFSKDDENYYITDVI